MGNSNGSQTQTPTRVLTPYNGVVWENFMMKREPHPDIPPDNGFNLCGYEIPELVLEIILSNIPENEFLKLNLVCRAWKDLLDGKLFWKAYYKKKGIDLENCGIPEHIRDKPGGWIVMFAQLRHKVFSKNYIRNPSGKDGYSDWVILKNGGDHWIIENEPMGAPALPVDENASSLEPDTHCFVSSYQWCSKYVVVDLWDQGLNPTVMRLSLPLEIKCSQMYSTRFDCGGVFRWHLRLLDSEENIIKDHIGVFELPANSSWETASYSFKFKTSHAEHMDQVRYVVFIHDGKDTQFWAGHYGMKFARSSVTFHCLDSEPESEPETDVESERESEFDESDPELEFMDANDQGDASNDESRD